MGHVAVYVALSVVVVCALAGSEGHVRASWWNDPCGLRPKRALSKVRWELVLVRRLRTVRRQLGITLESFRLQKPAMLYPKEVRDIPKPQYEQTWVPGKGNINMMQDKISKTFKVQFLFPELHTDLQKFAVAFEGMLEDSGTGKKRTALLRDTTCKLRQLLCEVEVTLSRLQVAVPPRQHADIMPAEELHPSSETARVVRDWGTLTKYRDYLKGWAQLLSPAFRRMRRHQRKRD